MSFEQSDRLLRIVVRPHFQRSFSSLRETEHTFPERQVPRTPHGILSEPSAGRWPPILEGFAYARIDGHSHITILILVILVAEPARKPV
jgi:hypothetical protein